jgi:hypothetical protein
LKLEIRPFSGPHDWGWIQQEVGLLRVEDTSGFMGINTEKNETVMACIMDNWLNSCVQLHFICTNTMALRYNFIETCFDFVFNEKGMNSAYAMIAQNNKKSLKIAKHMGFVEKTRLKDAYADGIDFILFEMLRKDCKYLPAREVA